MNSTPTQCLILACGNTLRGDDGIGPWLAEWALERFADNPRVSVISRHQWTPELAEDIAAAETVIFLDCSTESAPGSISVLEVHPSSPSESTDTHHMSAAQLLALAHELYNSLPRVAFLLTIGAGSTELSEQFSQPVLDAIPAACAKLDEAIAKLLVL